MSNNSSANGAQGVGSANPQAGETSQTGAAPQEGATKTDAANLQAGATPKAGSPKISVVVPAYNSQKYITQCLNSILEQTLSDLEIICINDGSTDDTLKIMKSFEQKDKRVKIIDKKNAGYGAGINDGFAAACGKYVAIVESDDYILPNMYEKLYKAAEQNNMPDIVKCCWYKFKGAGKKQKLIKRQPTKLESYYNRLFSPFDDPATLRLQSLNQPGIYRRDFITKNNIKLNESPGASYQDNGLCFQLFALAKSCYIIKDRLYMLRRDNPDSSFYAKDKVFAMCGEHHFIRQFVLNHPDLGKPQLEMAAMLRFHGYEWTMHRLGRDLRPMFAARAHEDFCKLQEAGEINPRLFSPAEYNQVQLMLTSGHFYFLSYRSSDNWRKSKERAASLQNSAEYKVGRKLLKLPRAILKRPQNHGVASDAPAQSSKKGGTGVRHENAIDDRPEGFVGALPNWKLLPQDLCEAVSSWYAASTLDRLDLDNPLTFNQKLQWLKLFATTPLKTQLADKYEVRKWVEQCIGKEYLIPLIGAYDNADEIDFEALPSSCVMKTNHGCGHVHVIDNKANFDFAGACADLQKNLQENFVFRWGFEIQYMNIKPKIIIEQNLNLAGRELVDYKFNCFDGKPYSIWCGTDTTNHDAHCRNSYDLNWNLLPESCTWPNTSKKIEKPDNLDDMLEVASKLSCGFAYVRVDLYNVDGKIYFGEMTFTPSGGVVKFDPPQAAWEYGDKIMLPPERDMTLLEQIEHWRKEALGI